MSAEGKDEEPEMGTENESVSSDSDCEMTIESSEEEEELTDEQKAEKAEQMKLAGNEYYKQKNYSQALVLYTEAIDICPNCTAYYGNRAATHMMMYSYSKALEDARRSVQIDPQFVKGHLREAKCHLSMGEAAAAMRSYQLVLELDKGNKTAMDELEKSKLLQQYLDKADQAYDNGDYRTVLFCMDRSIGLSPGCTQFKVVRGECLALLKRYQESQEIVNDLLRLDGRNADAIYVRGLCLYYQDNVEKAFQHFRQVLQLAPDHRRARDAYRKAKALAQKKEEGNAAFRQNKLQEAYDLYTEALSLDPNNVFTNSKLYFNRATVSSKLKKPNQAIEDCSKAVELDDSYLKAYLRRAKCYLEAEMYEEAVRDYEKINQMDRSRENRKLLQDAKLELKKSKRKDYYKLLGVGKMATEADIKKGYKKRALLHHPDRHSSATDEVRKEEEKKFKEIGEAYAVLTDPKKKARYDSGQDLDDMEGMGGGYHDIDPNQIFQAFFGGGGGPPGFGFQGGHGGHQHQHQHGGFPGGFSFQFG